jgi:phosphoglycolate phosphatase
MKSISLFIFDLDGTLINTLEDLAASVNHTRAHFGKKPLATEVVRSYIGEGINTLLHRVLDGQAELVDEALSVYKQHHCQNQFVHSVLYPSVKDTLNFFQNVPMAVITNKNMEFCGPLLQHLGIAHYFKMVVGADYGLPLKPAPDALLKIMEECRATKEHTIIVGDGETDMEAGKAAGVMTCAVTYGFRSAEKLKQTAPDFMINGFSELKKLFVPLK